MEYIIVENGIIIAHKCGASKPENAIEVPAGFGGYQGMKVAALKDDLSGPKPLSQQVAEGITEKPEGYKINTDDNDFIRMAQEEIDQEYPPKTYAIEGSFDAAEIRKTFNRDGQFGYWPQEGLTEMEGKQPSPAYRAQSGQWVFSLETGKELKLAELANAFDTASAEAHCTSSLGFEIDADETANKNIGNLITITGESDTVMFCDYHNQFHSVTLDNLKTMRDEVIAETNRIRQAKWTFRDAINAATTEADLGAINIDFGGDQ